ncbi:MAG TPA: hypothetical protein VNT32_01650 [Thermoleophilaceae bacterium]|nr:hypothetical protein [Thermoleophilaceae bacterium]
MTDSIFRGMEGLVGLLLLPVLAVALVFALHALWLVGAAAAQRLAGRRPARESLERAALEARAELGEGRREAAARAVLLNRRPTLVALAVAVRDVGSDITRRDVAESVYADLELRVTRALEPSRIHTRVGPLLGLMATLIPLGPALGALANRDVTTLAEKLEVAFTAPVVGLLIGGLGFATTAVRSRLFAEEMADAATLLDALAPEGGGGTPSSAEPAPAEPVAPERPARSTASAGRSVAPSGGRLAEGSG